MPLIPPPASLADEVFLRHTPAEVILALVGAGHLTLDDAWGPPTPGARIEFTHPAGTQAPRLLLWARHAVHGRTIGLPDDATWAQLGANPTGPLPLGEARHRLIAWAFSDPRAWTTPASAIVHAIEQTPLEWALEMNEEWALAAALRQPNAPGLPADVWAAAVVRAVNPGHLPTLVALTQAPAFPLADVWAQETVVHGLATAHPSPKGQGMPLLHLAKDPAVLDHLLACGLDPLAADDQGRSADERWRAQFDRRSFEGQRQAPLLERLDAALAALPPESTTRQRRRQERHRFVHLDAAAFKEWLATQPRDLALAEPAQWPSEALVATDGTPSELARRAAALFQHLTPEALDRVGADGVRERDALWWAVASGFIQEPFGPLKKAWRDVTAPDAWLDLLAAGPALVQRARSQPFGQTIAVTAAAMAEKALRALSNTPAAIDTNLDRMTPTSPERWDAPGPDGGPSPLEWVLRTAGASTLPSGLQSWAPLLADWARAHPRTQAGQPRDHLLESCLRLAWSALVAMPDSQLSTAAFTHVLRDGKVSPLGMGSGLHLLAAAHALVHAGARPSDGVIYVFANVDKLKAIGAILQEQRLAATFEVPAPRPASRPRM